MKTTITGDRLVDVLMSENRAWRIYWQIASKKPHLKANARTAWDELNPMMLSEEFDRGEADILTKCLIEEVNRRNAATLIPQLSTPDAETLLPGEALPAEPVTTSKTAKTTKRPPSSKTRRLPSNPLPFIETPSIASTTSPKETDWLSQKAAEVQGEVQARSEMLQLALPVVAEPERAAPNLWLRSALFGVNEKQKGERRAVLRKPLPTPWVKGKADFTGRELDQADLDLMLQMLHMASSQGGAGVPIGFTDRGMLKALGKAYGSAGLKWLDESAHRLIQAVVTVDDGTKQLSFHLVETYGRKGQQRAFVLSKTVMGFFQGANFSALQWKARLALKGDLTRWLHGFLTSQPHTRHGVSLELLKELSGTSTTRPIRKFKADIERALKQLLVVDDLHLGLVDAKVTSGKDGPKLVWACNPDRRGSLQQLRAEVLEEL